MNYDDFPILENKDYELLKNQYQLSRENNKHEICAKVYNSLILLYHTEILDIKNFKSTIISEINKSKENILKIIENFKNLYNFSENNDKNIQKMNIFTFLYQIMNIINDSKQWQKQEEKPYYKQFINQNIDIFHNIVSNILFSLKNSIFYYFKYL